MTAACREERQGLWLMFYRLQCRHTRFYEPVQCHYKETWESFSAGFWCRLRRYDGHLPTEHQVPSFSEYATTEKL